MASNGLSTDELLAALPDRIERVQRSWGFRLRLTAALAVLLAIVVVYLGLLVVTSYGLWSHWASASVVTTIRRAFMSPAVYGAFCVAGPILCAFLVKPVFTGGRAKATAITLERQAEPRLFAFIDRLCSAQGAPPPRRIRVDTDVNASAGLRHGLISLFRDDLVLTIGLPLVRAMTLRELTGVLAHEFGHFAQGSAMRLSYVIRVVTNFLLRISHERDGFDEALVEASRFRSFLDIRITLILWLFALFMHGVRVFLWAARSLMKGLAWVALAASAALLREMEYDADRHEARISGQESFASVGNRLIVLGAARQAAASLQHRWWITRRLADDVPAVIVAMATKIASETELVQQLQQEEFARTTKLFDTHPALRDRLASVARNAEPGAFTLNASASVLFNDLNALCQAATLADYKELFSFENKRAVVVPVPDLLFEIGEDLDSAESLTRFLMGCPISACRITLDANAENASRNSVQIDEARARIVSARARVLDLAPAARETARKLEDAIHGFIQSDLEGELIKARAAGGTSPPDLEDALEAKRLAAEQVQAQRAALVPYSNALNERLQTAIALHLAQASVLPSEAVDPATNPERVVALIETLAGLVAVRPDVDVLRDRLALLLALLKRSALEPESFSLKKRVSDAGMRAYNQTKAIRNAVITLPYPFSRGIRLADQTPVVETVGSLIADNPGLLDPIGIHGLGIEALTLITNLEARLISTLIPIAEQVESALGLPVLPNPIAHVAENNAEETRDATAPTSTGALSESGLRKWLASKTADSVPPSATG